MFHPFEYSKPHIQEYYTIYREKMQEVSKNICSEWSVACEVRSVGAICGETFLEKSFPHAPFKNLEQEA